MPGTPQGLLCMPGCGAMKLLVLGSNPAALLYLLASVMLESAA